jgi:hypothetical protein
MSVAPDLIDPVLGFRAFEVGSDGLLRSPWVDGWVWRPGMVTARCRQTRLTGWVTHIAPGRNCTCGLYAYTELDGRLLEGGRCIASIAAWGEMELHAAGFRAQHACAVALAAGPDTDLAERELIARTAERYSVMAVPLRKLVEEGSRHARALRAAPDPLALTADRDPTWGYVNGGQVTRPC